MSRLLVVLIVAISGVMAAPVVRATPVLHEVTGVRDGDMLKLRAGPGTGYVVIVGLPNGTGLIVHDCQRIGGTRWCHVSLDRARALKGYVSGTYLQRR